MEQLLGLRMWKGLGCDRKATLGLASHNSGERVAVRAESASEAEFRLPPSRQATRKPPCAVSRQVTSAPTALRPHVPGGTTCLAEQSINAPLLLTLGLAGEVTFMVVQLRG